MPAFTKKPVTIEARQFETNNAPDSDQHMDSLVAWMGDRPCKAHHDGTAIYIETLEGTHRADVGDWIIRGVKGEFYPCKPDIFAATYEAGAGAAVASEGDQRTANNAVRHHYRVLSDEEKARMVRIKDLGAALLEECRDAGGQRRDMDGPFSSRELSIAATKTEEAVMWAVKHVTK
ncbi:DUF7681 family protein [Aurantimonas coralicida]|uniref:Acb2/Tad1 domain-containing protein n=1 Tax=Aurantimonas coralicida TaxID=182270 RepID=UPI002393D76F|nr:hypothetical protein [Aurantimonas coralicida]MDE0921495.1 hypothetical protein [Aurantimonas coralicida]